MKFKKNSIIFSIFFIISIQILLLINNSQKTSFRFFIWNIEYVSIGRLICISFISGLFMSSILNYTLHNNRIYPENNGNEDNNYQNEDFINDEDNYESNEIPPERDLREPQPTISVNYRVIKDNDNSENVIIDGNQTSKRGQYNDDWYKNDSEW